MKSLIIASLIYIFTNIFFSTTDYRDSYIGSYTCKEICKRLNSSNIITYDTLNYSIIVSKSTLDSTIKILTREGELNMKLINKAFINKTGRCFGHFSGDSIYVTNIQSLGPISFKYMGKK